MGERQRFPRHVYLGILKRQRLICACGCGVKITRSEGYQFDHAHHLAMGGCDEPANLHALRIPCHRAKTGREAKARAKVRRIRATDGLMVKRPTKNSLARARARLWDEMP